MHRVGPSEDKGRAEDDVPRMKKRMLLELLVTCRRLAVALCRIDDSAARDAFGLRGQTKDPSETDKRRDTDSDRYVPNPSYP